MRSAGDTLSGTFAALADPTRRAILSRLAEGPASVGDLARPFSISRPAISQHLRVLREAELIEQSVDARWRPCALRPEGLAEAEEWVRRHRQAWNDRFDRLEAQLDDIAASSPPDKSDAMTEFTIERTFAAPRPVIWRAWTDPVVASRWWHPAGFTTDPASVRIDLRPGGRYAYTMVGPDGSTHPTEGSYVAVRPPEHLQFTWSDPGRRPSDAPLVTVDLTDLAGQRTAMRFHMSRFGATPDMLTNVRGGWQEAFDILASVL